MDAALFPLRQMGIRILNYRDDWLILAQSEAVSTLHKTLLPHHLSCLGLRVNFSKSILSPSQWVSFLGTVIDSVQMTTTVSAERATMIKRRAASFKEETARSRLSRKCWAAAEPLVRFYSTAWTNGCLVTLRDSKAFSWRGKKNVLPIQHLRRSTRSHITGNRGYVYSNQVCLSLINEGQSGKSKAFNIWQLFYDRPT